MRSVAKCHPRGAVDLETGGSRQHSLRAPRKFATYTEMLDDAVYMMGNTSKGWSPGRLEPGGRTLNPAGDTFESFDQFMGQRPADKPFCF